MSRHALIYPVRPEKIQTALKVLRVAGDPPLEAGATRLRNTSVYHKDGVVVRVFDIDGDIDELIEGLAGAAAVHEVGRHMAELLDSDGHDFSTVDGLRRFFADNLMTVITDRYAVPKVPS